MLFYVEWSAGVQSKDNHTLLCDDISRSRGSWNCFVIWQSRFFELVASSKNDQDRKEADFNTSKRIQKMSLLRDVMWKKKFNGHKIKHSIQKKYVQSCFQRMNENFKNANVVLLLFTTYRNVVGVTQLTNIRIVTSYSFLKKDT